ncbi:hypothetical protein U9M48_041291 [Paspalum notatum var. saurae]|uniref:Uncharacterized protein n=1 Tax=Paspalum notatum var. saurae TaxID=547442 RepID=A0AAQ3UMX8_PASNO
MAIRRVSKHVESVQARRNGKIRILRGCDDAAGRKKLAGGVSVHLSALRQLLGAQNMAISTEQ